MRILKFDDVAEQAAKMCGQAACDLPLDVKRAIADADAKETCPTAKSFFEQYRQNYEIAETTRLPLCQDTGFAVWFVEMGVDCRLDRGTVRDALTAGTEAGYKRYFLRKSIVSDPLFERKNTGTNTPIVLHLDQVPGDKLKLTLAPKGGGSENVSALAMLKPAQGRAGVIDFVVESVVKAGGNSCPPTVVGVGIGGTAEIAVLLAKKALCRTVGEPNPDPRYAELEREILAKINATGVGAQGLGGVTTSFAVHINSFPCHIASLPVAVNLNCHAARHTEVIL